MQLPLSGIRVIDLTRILSGPFCTMLLGDMGADVIKVEGPDEGDPIRRIGAGHGDISWYFASYNRNKRSVILDIKTSAGKETLARLLEDADVLVENYRPGVLDAMGFDQERLDRINPRLVVAGINGYGASGPYADRPAFDFVIQAMSGFMSVNGHADAGPVRCAPPITDLIAGLYAAFGVVNGWEVPMWYAPEGGPSAPAASFGHGPEYPLIAAEIGPGLTAPDAASLAQLWLNMGAQWRQVAAQIETARLGAVYAVEAAASEAEIAAIEAAFQGALP